MKENMRHLSFWFWLVLFNTMIFSSTNFCTIDKISFFFVIDCNFSVQIHQIFFINLLNI